MTKQAEIYNPIYNDEAAARAHLERLLWPDGPICFHCGVVDEATLLKGESTRPGLYKCRACRKPFTVTMGTIYERSHIPLHKWFLATHLLCSSKKGMSASQLHRELGFGSYRTAWFMAHRIREAMKPGPDGRPPLGEGGRIVEADETYYGKTAEPKESPYRRDRPYKKGSRGPRNKRAVVALVERGGSIRTFHVGSADQFTVHAILKANVSPDAMLSTDESRLYAGALEWVADHGTVKHSAGEYVRDWVHTNSLEGYFSIFKRGMRGIYQHCAEKHLHRYLAEYDFRYNHRIALGFNDNDRTELAILGAHGKRLTYRRTHAA
jgi:transposase-like protein